MKNWRLGLSNRDEDQAARLLDTTASGKALLLIDCLRENQW